MRIRLSYPSIVVLSALMLSGCNSLDNKVAKTVPKQDKPPEASTYSDGARRITIGEAQDLMKKGQVFVVDVRNQSSFDAGHIPGAKLIPEGEIVARANELPRDKMILTYCS
jgi:3-mercaptopyruvate sulfurtransferase SseA